MARNAVETQGAAAASDPTERSGEVMSGWAHGSESKEGSGGKSKGESQEEESCRREEKEKEDIGVFPTTLGQSTRGRSHPSGEYWKILDHGI